MLYQRAPRNIHRHVILSEVKEAVAALPSVRGVWNCVPVRVQLPTGRLVCHVGWSCCRGSVPVASSLGLPHRVTASVSYSSMVSCFL